MVSTVKNTYVRGHPATELRSCVKVEVPYWAPIPNSSTVFVDVKLTSRFWGDLHRLRESVRCWREDLHRLRDRVRISLVREHVRFWKISIACENMYDAGGKISIA